MAIWPCMRCGQRFSGEAQNVYATWYDGDERESYRFVVDALCLAELLEEWRRAALQKDELEGWVYSEPGATPRRLGARPAPPRRPRGRREVPEELPDSWGPPRPA